MPQLANTLKVASKGSAILNDPRLNKGTAFTEKERGMFGLKGCAASAMINLR
jgi:malate dehydrogenase (oxaloacetate-decarboxylating)